jgi:hypothetical protein
VSAALLTWLVVANAQQTGVITGRVVTEDGAGMANVTVALLPAGGAQRAMGRQFSTATDEDGNFKFTGVPSRTYTIGVTDAKGYVRQPIPAAERSVRSLYRAGDNALITMVRGGVITGRVTSAAGEPMIGVMVSALSVRDAEGNPTLQQFGRQRSTDDRGVYRLYGLTPGTYILVVRNMLTQRPSPYDGDIPTYYPSSPRDTAGEIKVTSGSEATGIDIQYRGEHGRVVSGMVTGGGEPSQPYTSANVTLYNAATRDAVGSAFVRPEATASGFAIYGAIDGEYALVARRGGYNEEPGFSSPPQRVTVKGADVSGIELKLAPQASIAGKVVVEGSANACKAGRIFSAEEIIVSLRRDEKASEPRTFYSPLAPEASPNDKGEFTIRNIEPARYFLEPRLPAGNWYVKSVATAGVGGASGARRPAAVPDVSRAGVALKAGDKITGLTMTIAGDAASLSGKVIPAEEGARLPSRVRIHLAPAEAAASDDVLRYAEAVVHADGAFSFGNLAQGKYWLLARAVPEDELIDRPPSPVAWDSAERVRLRKEAEASKNQVELKSCQRVSDLIVKYEK